MLRNSGVIRPLGTWKTRTVRLLTKELIGNVIALPVCLNVSHIHSRNTSKLILPNNLKLPDCCFKANKEFACVNWKFSQVAKRFSQYCALCCSPSQHQPGCWVILIASAPPVQVSALPQRE